MDQTLLDLAKKISKARFDNEAPYKIRELESDLMRYARAQSSISHEDALRILLDFVCSGQRYESRNPYTIAAVEVALKALGVESGIL